MMKQYLAIRRGLPEDVLLFFRLGDFYELFFEDAKVAAPLLNVALTKRGGVPMCGVPHHSSQGYIAKLISQGKRVAIAEQTSEPVPGKIVERAVSQIISAATVNDSALLEDNRPNYLVAILRHGNQLGLACCDHGTGEFLLSQHGSVDALQDELNRLQAAELLHSQSQQDLCAAIGHPVGAQALDDYLFLPEEAQLNLCRHFKVKSLDGFGCTEMPAALGAAGAILHYLQQQLRRSVDHLLNLSVQNSGECVLLDAATQTHLDLVDSRGNKGTTLLSALDRSCTPMGGRRLRSWVLQPLNCLEKLNRRQDAIAALLEQPVLLGQVRSLLSEVRDMERTASRLSQNGGNARDLQVLAQSLEVISPLRALLEELPCPLLRALPLHPQDALVAEIRRAVVDEPPATVKEGGMIRAGYLPELDELRAASTEGQQWIAQLQAREIERTGIKSLKIRYNAVFGYFIEITKANLDAVPADYHRKQTTVSGERYITDELKQMEHKILGAQERSRTLEHEIFVQLRARALEHLSALQQCAAALGDLDALGSLAEVARLHGYCRPQLEDSRLLHIEGGRHPVLDQQLQEGGRFVPNDVHLNENDCRLILLTGPNMAGKSTYLKQVALLTLMAQMGSYIPARSARIGLVDRIFTRIGASDDLARGRSTFMVEMNETALILRSATERSLVILDEIGRGTSTFDGLSIAWSVAEYLHDCVGARALFATHYHELTTLAQSRAAVKNFSVAVRESQHQILFLHQIIAGAAEKSYGIQVARLAGLPPAVIERSCEVLAELEAGHPPAQSVREVPAVSSVAARPKRRSAEPDQNQMNLFG
jgi:DNA mismatch repair protein MutS